MKFNELKVGMKVRAIDNYYMMTSKRRGWTGFVVKICNDGTFFAKTTRIIDPDPVFSYHVWDNLKPEHFEVISSEEEKIATANEVAKVVRKKDTYYVVYNGKIVASATCRKDDNFNEEFGLNLALRRFCKTLCNENTTKKVVYNTDKVEDFI